jgi:hypothetical protein
LPILFTSAENELLIQARLNQKEERFPEKELREYSPNSYIQVSVSDLFIPLIGLPILL